MQNEKKQTKKSLIVMKSTLSRLPMYYYYLLEKSKQGEDYVSSTAIAETLSLNPVQVRKDLASISTVRGKPNHGFLTMQLMADLREYMGYDHDDEAVMVGVGRLGSALMHYDGFEHCGVNIVAGFDTDPEKVGTVVNDKPVLDMAKMPSLLKRLGVQIAILAVPLEVAQTVADQLIAAGVRAIWNWSPTLLNVPDGVVVKNENVAATLAWISAHLHDKKESKKK